jgi:hypothetical protein
LIDFVRFYKGWSGGKDKPKQYAFDRVDKLMTEIDKGLPLSQDEYRAKIDLKFNF